MGLRVKGESPRKTPADQEPSASGRQRRVAGGCGKRGARAREKAAATRARSVIAAQR
jgi:hypothetical protein